MGALGNLGAIFRGVGQGANDIAQGSIDASKRRDDQLQQQFQMLLWQLQMQEIQERLRKSQQQQYLGSFTTPSGAVEGITQGSEGQIGTQQLYGGVDQGKAAASAQDMFNALDPEGQLHAKSIFQGLLQNSGGDYQKAMEGTVAFIKPVYEKLQQQQGVEGERSKLAGELGLTGEDAKAAKLGLTGATSYSFTPGGKRALRPPAAGAGITGDVAADAKAVMEHRIPLPTGKFGSQILDYIARHPEMGATPAKIDALTQRQINDDRVLSKQLADYSKILEDSNLTTINIPSYFAWQRAQYAMGRSTQWTDLINKVERFNVTAMKSLTTSRNMKMIDMIRTHLPNFWTDSPETIYKKMQDVQGMLQQDALVKMGLDPNAPPSYDQQPSSDNAAPAEDGEDSDVIVVKPEDVE